MLYIYLLCPPPLPQPLPFLTLSLSLSSALSNKRKQCRCSTRSLFAKLNANPSGACKSFGTVSDRYIVWVIGQVNEMLIHSYTQGPQETSLLVHSGSLAKAGEGSSRARAAAPARSFVWRLIPVSRLDKPKRVILQRLRSRISTRFSS